MRRKGIEVCGFLAFESAAFYDILCCFGDARVGV
jgi:hypothetical protein